MVHQAIFFFVRSEISIRIKIKIIHFERNIQSIYLLDIEKNIRIINMSRQGRQYD